MIPYEYKLQSQNNMNYWEKEIYSSFQKIIKENSKFLRYT